MFAIYRCLTCFMVLLLFDLQNKTVFDFHLLQKDIVLETRHIMPIFVPKGEGPELFEFKI